MHQLKPGPKSGQYITTTTYVVEMTSLFSKPRHLRFYDYYTKSPARADYLQVIVLITRELSGFTCTRSLTMNLKFLIPHEAAECGIVSKQVQVNPDNSRGTSALTYLLLKLNTLRTKIVKLSVSRSHGVITVVC